MSQDAKRLTRSVEDRMIGGVAAGIADYFGIDPTLVRLVFALSLLAGGSGMVLYIILWVVMPESAY